MFIYTCEVFIGGMFVSFLKHTLNKIVAISNKTQQNYGT